MRRTLRALTLILCVGALFTSCAPKSAKLIGIAKFVSHPALDAIEKGIQDELADSKPDY